MRRLHLVLVVVALGAAGRAEGQGIADLPAGARVRITIPDSARLHPSMPRAQSVIGTFARASSDTLWLQVAGPDPVRVPRGAIREKAVLGGAIGAVLAGVVGAVRPYERWKRVR